VVLRKRSVKVLRSRATARVALPVLGKGAGRAYDKIAAIEALAAVPT